MILGLKPETVTVLLLATVFIFIGLILFFNNRE